MKKLLAASVTVNLLLTGMISWLGLEGQIRSTRPVRPAEPASRNETLVKPGATGERIVAAPVSFRWSQLESTNYLTYIANLRSIGCPEQTIRDLISAEVDSWFAPLREKVLREPASGAGAAVPAIGQGATSKLERLHEDEIALIDRMLHPENSLQVAVAERGERPQGPVGVGSVEESGRERAEVQIPQFMQNPGSSFEFTTAQLEALNEVREWFRGQIGGSNVDPRDPEYLRRWRWAQPGADALLRASLGPEAYMRYQVALLDQQAGAQ